MVNNWHQDESGETIVNVSEGALRSHKYNMAKGSENYYKYKASAGGKTWYDDQNINRSRQFFCTHMNRKNKFF